MATKYNVPTSSRKTTADTKISAAYSRAFGSCTHLTPAREADLENKLNPEHPKPVPTREQIIEENSPGYVPPSFPVDIETDENSVGEDDWMLTARPTQAALDKIEREEEAGR